MRTVFAGTPEFALPVFDALAAAAEKTDLEIVAVLTQPDRPAGRGRRISMSPVKKRAIEAGMTIEQPDSLNSPAAQSKLSEMEPDLLVVVAYGLLLPATVLAIPRLGCINVHASLLPRWRGAAPIQHAILAGDRVGGVSIMKMNEGLDEGPVYLRREIEIGADETGSELHDRLAILGAQAMMEALPGIVDGSLTAQPQDDSDASYAGKISKADARLDFGQDAVQLQRMVRAFNAWPVAWCQWQKRDDVDPETLRIWQARAEKSTADGAPPGTVVKADGDGIRIATADGDLIAERLQLPGRKPLSAGDFCNACDLGGLHLY